MKGNGENRCFVHLHRLICLGSLQFLLKSEVEMVPVKPVETLHNYLRRHFEKVAKRKARQFAEQTEVPKVQVDPDSRSSDGHSGTSRPRVPEVHNRTLPKDLVTVA
jgi:hypothetical protein